MLSTPVVVGIADMCMATNSVSVQTTYAAAFARAGNTPLVLPAETNRAVVARMLASVDVLLLCGGEDVEPSRYKAKPSPRLGEVNLRRDAWEFLLLDEAVKRRLPVIGICRGCQLINVYFGGTLWQDLPSERPGEVVHRGKDAFHDIQIVAGSRLADYLGTDRLKVNSFHHQAVRDLAPGFRAVAFAPDGVVEAIESETMPIVGVQFHPEKLLVNKGRSEFKKLFTDLLGWTGASRATDLAKLTTPCAYTNEAGEVLLYRLAAPKGNVGPMPLVLFLHGAGERGCDNVAQLKHGVGPILDFFAERNEPVCLLAPQCPKERKWVEVDWSAASHAMPPEASVSMRLALELVEKTMRTRNIDPARVYVTGLSMGGFGTWDVIARRPDLFAAAMPICGGGDTHQVQRFRTMPVYVVHGGADKVVPTARSRAMVAALWAVDGRVHYTEYPGCGHNSWSQAYADKVFLGRFFKHRSDDAQRRKQ
jgi:gamma-glutamyl-gamma-aminobutyrate hydrolase PuuD/predicted esterase